MHSDTTTAQAHDTGRGRRAARPARLRRALLAACLAALLAAVLGGAAAPPAAATPSAAQIDAFLAAHGSPMTGTGAAFVAEGSAHGVDPAFLVAVAGAETSFGLYLYQRDGDQCTYNAFNWFYGPSWPESDFGSWDEAIARVAQGIGGEWYYGSGLYAVAAIAPRYCPDGTGEWVANVTSFMTELGGDPDDTRIAASGPPVVQPGLVALDGDVRVDGRGFKVGDRVTVRFTITNDGGSSLALDALTLAVRSPAGTSRDMTSREPLTLAPGESREITASWALDLAGDWHGWIQVEQAGEVSRVGARQAFRFEVRLPHRLELRRWHLRESALTQAL